MNPRENNQLEGHLQAKQIFLELYNANTLPHAFLLTGVKGIGKATLAYQMAKFMLSGEKATADSLFGDELKTSLSINPESKTFLKVANNSHPDLLVLDTSNDDSTAATKTIKVDDARKIGNFLRLTPAETKYRIVIIDSVDEMNVNAANSVLKLLEEPPANAYLFLVSHAPGRILPTIKSRCRMLRLNPLSESETQKIIKDFYSPAKQAELKRLITLMPGSPGFVINLYEAGGLDIYDLLVELLLGLKARNAQLLDQAIDKLLGKKDKQAFAMFMDIFYMLLAGIIKFKATSQKLVEINGKENSDLIAIFNKTSIEQLLDLQEVITRYKNDSERIHLNKKLILITLFEKLATN